MSLWTKGELAALKRAAAKVYPDRLTFILECRKFRPTATFNAIEHALTRNGIPSPRIEASPTPLERQERRDQLKESRQENEKLIEELRSLREQYDAMSKLREQKPLKPIVHVKAGKNQTRQGVPVLLCSDWHVEEPVEPETVAGMNVYNLEIAEKCIEKLFDSFLWLSDDKRFDCRTAIVAFLGDLFSGHIHEELVEKCFLSPTKATLWLQPRIEKGLRKVKQHFDRVIVTCVDGNHGRTTKRIRVSSRVDNSYEHLMYQNLAYRMQDEPGIEFHISLGQHVYLDVFDQTFMFFHGDSVNYQGGVGGVTIPMKKYLDRLRKYERTFHLANFGHFHTSLDLPTFVGNGSMIGINAYGMSKGFDPEPRQQRWYMVDSRRGKCISAPVWLD